MPLVSLYTAWKHTSFLFPLDSLKAINPFYATEAPFVIKQIAVKHFASYVT